MKTTLILISLCLLCSVASYGQTATILNSEAHMTVVPDHPEHAAQHEMAQMQNILASDVYTYAQGERPLWEFGPVNPPAPPLGDIARNLRKEHAVAKKAEVIWDSN